ncbi:MAG: HAMP domain-containing sensor histidine kinase [bacterium]
MIAGKKKTENKEGKSRHFTEFFKVQVATLVGLSVFGTIPLIFPGSFGWISNPKIYMSLLIFLFVFQVIVLFFTEFFRMSFVWKYSGYIWTVAYILVIYITGGLDSSFIFLLILIPVISIYQLDPKLTKSVVISSTVFLALLIFTDAKYFSNYSYLTKYILIVFGYGLIGYYIYQFVNETLSEKVKSEQLKRRISELDELDHTKQVFLSAMSHQLRTPLNGVKWGLEAVLKDGKCENFEILNESHNRVEEAISTIGKILKTAELEIDKNNIEVKNERINLSGMIHNIVNKLDYLIKSNVVTLTFASDDEPVINGDEKMLDLALANIIDNAFRYSPKGKVKINIIRSSNDAILTVEDNGIGIDTKDLPFVANQKFYRGRNAMTIDPNESGIGLYTTKKIIELHGGKFDISSTLNKGTKVSVSLPLAK